MFGWIKRLGRKKPPRYGWDCDMVNPGIVRANILRAKIATAKRQKKKHSHLAAELARLEKDSTQ